MSYLLEPVRPKRRTLCNVLRKSTNWKCLILTNLILSCLGAIIWCRNTRITKILVDFDAFPIASRRQVSPCEDGYVYIPIAFVIMLYLLYLVECWHSNARVQLSIRKVDVGSVYRKIRDMKASQPVIWWKAICYHYVRRVRQTTRRRNGETLTSSQTYYERVNSNSRGSSFFYNACGMKDYSKEVVDLEKYPATKIKFSKGFVFANLATVSEFEEQRSTFFREQERLDDYMEMREGFEFPNIHFTETVMAWSRPENPPWFGRINVFWVFSLLLLSWPLRICLELNTSHLHYKITKLFGINYPPDTHLFELERPLVTSNYLQHIMQQQQSTGMRRVSYQNLHLRSPHHQQQRRNRNRLSPAHARTPPTRIPFYQNQNSLEENSSSSSSSSSTSAASQAEPLLPQNALSHNSAKEKSSSQSSSAPPEYCKTEGNSTGTVFGSSAGWSNFASSLFRRTLSATRNTPFFPRSVTLMIEPQSKKEGRDGWFGAAKRNYSFYSNSVNPFNGDDEEEEELLVPSYSEALLLLEPKERSNGSDDDNRVLNAGNQQQQQQPLLVNYDNDSQSPSNSNDNDSTCTTYHSSPHHPSAEAANLDLIDRNRETNDCGHEQEHEHEQIQDFATVTTTSAGLTTLPAAVELDLTHPIVVPSSSDARRGRAVVNHNSPSCSTNTRQESAELIQELPPSYIEALQTSRPVFISTLTRLRRCFTERDLAGGLSSSSSIGGGISNNSHHQPVRDRIQQSWLNYYARTNPSFLQRFHTSRTSITDSNTTNRNGSSGGNEQEAVVGRNQSESSSRTTTTTTRDRSEV